MVRDRWAAICVGLFGWFAAVLLACVAPSPGLVLLDGMSALATLSLLLQRSFPKRREALVLSWGGPAILAGAALLEQQAWAQPAAFGRDPSTVGWRAAGILLVSGLAVALYVTWLIRGYGLIALLALLGPVWRGDRERVVWLATEYPYRRWWLVPLCFVLLVVALAAVTGCLEGPGQWLGPSGRGHAVGTR